MDKRTIQSTDVINAIWTKAEADSYASELGIKLSKLEYGYALVTLALNNGDINNKLILSLINAAFTFACATFGAVIVPMSMSIIFHGATDEGNILTAESCEVHRKDEITSHEIRVFDVHNKLVATCVGFAHIINDHISFT